MSHTRAASANQGAACAASPALHLRDRLLSGRVAPSSVTRQSHACYGIRITKAIPESRNRMVVEVLKLNRYATW
jgi:hypothetical protein